MWRRRSSPSASSHVEFTERIDQLGLHEENAARRQGLISNIPAYAGAAIIVLVIAKVAVVSRGSSSTMLALISDASPLQVLSGSIISLLPFSGLIVIYANENRYKYRPGLAKVRLRQIQYAIYLTIFLLSFLLSVSWLAMILAILLIRHLVFEWDVRRGKAVERSTPLPRDEWLRRPPSDVVLHDIWGEINRKEEQKQQVRARNPVDLAEIARLDEDVRTLSTRFNERADQINRFTFSQGAMFGPVIALYSVTLLIQFFGNAKPWVPAELISLKDKKAEVGYVISAGDSWTTVLTEDSRIVVRIPSAKITSRTICGLTKEGRVRTQTIYTYFRSGKPVYKPCPKSGEWLAP
ncbi:hypothetical protein [Streptomyces sp. NPDC040750]|uniref:hypothetical protein n=1 Tax=Streptomyces sp. NPDC040750 TaxID=3154491 RepID=UPI0033D73333